MFNRFQAINTLYRSFIKPGAFLLDAEKVHDRVTGWGERLGRHPKLLAPLNYQNPGLTKKVLGIEFANPIGLAAGFDYNGHLAQTMGLVGFGFNTVGTVTAQPYAGNSRPRLKRLIKSQSILVNKGFKTDGALKVATRLDRQRLNGHTIGISVGSSNLPSINTLDRAIADYQTTIEVFRNRPYVSYFELNISCPNTALAEPFTASTNFRLLARAVADLKLKQPVLVKMPNELADTVCFELIDQALDYGIKGFIFGNLVKERQNPQFDPAEIAAVQDLKGHFSGQPTQANVIAKLQSARRRYGTKIALVGCGGTFNTYDARVKLEAGADLVQLITGLIFTGPALASEINRDLAVNPAYSAKAPR